MSVDVEVLFGEPQREIASLLRDRILRCQSSTIASRRS